VSVKPATDNLYNVIKNFQDFITNTIKVPVAFLPHPTDKKIIIQETTDIKGVQLEMVIVSSEIVESLKDKTVASVHKNKQHFSPEDVRKKLKTTHISNEPSCNFVNIELCEQNGPSDITSTACSVLLENPKGQFLLSNEALVRQVQVVFGIHGKKPVLYLNSNKTNPINKLSKEEIMNLHSRTLYAYLS